MMLTSAREAAFSNPVIKLAPEFIGLVERGEKTTTVRYGRRDYRPGAVVFEASDNSSKLSAVIERVDYMRFCDLSEAIAKTDGFKSLEELKGVVKKFYPQVLDNDEITVVAFSSAKRMA